MALAMCVDKYGISTQNDTSRQALGSVCCTVGMWIVPTHSVLLKDACVPHAAVKSGRVALIGLAAHASNESWSLHQPIQERCSIFCIVVGRLCV